MRKLLVAAIAAALLVGACSAEPIDDSPALEDGTYTATLKVRNTRDWESVTWEKGHGYNI